MMKFMILNLKINSGIFKAACCVSLTFFLASCGEQTPSLVNNVSHDTADTTTLAKVGNDSINTQEFFAYMEAKRITTKPGRHRDRALRTYVERTALANLIVSEGLLPEAVIQAEARDSFNEAIINRYFDKQLNENVNDDDLKTYFEDHSNEFADREYKLAQIYFRFRRSDSENRKQQQREKAEKIRESLIAGEDFEEAAKRHSQDPVTASKGGELGWIRKGLIANELMTAAAMLSIGDISQVIETTEGLYILKLLDEPRFETVLFDDVKDKIRLHIIQQLKNNEKRRLLDKADYRIY